MNDGISRASLLAALSGAAAFAYARRAPAGTIPGIGGKTAPKLLMATPPPNAPAIDSPGQLATELRRMADAIEATPVGDTGRYCDWIDVATMLVYFHDEIVRHGEQSKAWQWSTHHSPCPAQ